MIVNFDSRVVTMVLSKMKLPSPCEFVLCIQNYAEVMRLILQLAVINIGMLHTQSWVNEL